MKDNLLIAQDALKFLNIRECFFITESSEQLFFRPIYMEIDKWIVIASGQVSLNGRIRIVLDKKTVEINCRTESVKVENFSNCYMFIFLEPMPEEILKKLIQVKKTFRASSRRREERFEIGTALFKKFGFSAPVQHFSYKEQKFQCLVNNVSVHGAMITCGKSDVKIGERINLLFSFANPTENISQFAIVVNRTSVSGGHLQLSLNFLEPVSFLWQKRICSFAEKN